MSLEEWRKVPSEKRKEVEDAASNLGLSIDQLREKLLIVAAMQSDEGVAPSEVLVVEEDVEDASIQPVVTPDDVSDDVRALSLEGTVVDGADQEAAGAAIATKTRYEMKWWKERCLLTSTIESLESGEAAECFAAFFSTTNPDVA